MFNRVINIWCTVLALLLSFVSNAQCAMCKAANESNEGSAEGFNAAILFLMITPYIIGLVAVIIFIIYWKKRKNKILV